MSKTAPEWLLVVDMQPGFGHPDSPWASPDYEACAKNVVRLVDAFGDRVLFTRFVPPEKPSGAWLGYYDQHPFALAPENRSLWELDPRWSNRPSVSSHRFAKWVEAAPHIPADAELVICGVATDCCVLGTVIEANDAGRKVRLPVDACAAGTKALHEAAIAILSDRGGLLELSDTDREHARLSRQWHAQSDPLT